MATRATTGLAILAAAVFAACGPSDAPAPVEVELVTQVMGTRLVVTARAPDSATAQRAAQSGSQVVARVDSLMSTYRADSEVSLLAAAAGGGDWISLSRETVEVLAASLDWARRSGGAFDPTVEPLMEAWGFRDTIQTRPSDDALALALRAVGWSKVELDSAGGRARLPVAGMKLDFGAIAKGYALDLAVAEMRAAGALGGMVDLGGQVNVFGTPLSGREAWLLGVRHPRATSTLMGTVAVDSGSISTSGDYEQMFEQDGIRYAHIMDPRTGTPARGMVAVTVAAPSGFTADALSTILFVLGPEEGHAFLDRELPGAPLTVVWVRDPGERELGADDVVSTGSYGRLDLELPRPTR
jgi:thiamine biosynthesis lipoprotein